MSFDGTCAITAFDVSAPVGFVGGNPFPIYAWDAALGRMLNVLYVFLCRPLFDVILSYCRMLSTTDPWMIHSSLRGFGFSNMDTTGIQITNFLAGFGSIFRVSGNSVNAPVPAPLTQLSLVYNIDLSGNSFMGTMPGLFSNPSLIQKVDFSVNSVRGNAQTRTRTHTHALNAPLDSKA